MHVWFWIRALWDSGHSSPCVQSRCPYFRTHANKCAKAHVYSHYLPLKRLHINDNRLSTVYIPPASTAFIESLAAIETSHTRTRTKDPLKIKPSLCQLSHPARAWSMPIVKWSMPIRLLRTIRYGVNVTHQVSDNAVYTRMYQHPIFIHNSHSEVHLCILAT